MNVSFNSFSSYAISSLKEAILPSLSAQSKKILMIASFALGCLAACLAAYYYITRHCSFTAYTGEYSTIGQDALAFAREKLNEHPETKPFFFRAGWAFNDTHQPINQEIASLTTLYWDVYDKALEEAIKQDKDDPWSKQEVIEAADACMKIAFAISCLTLDDLPAFTQNFATSKNEQRTYAQALTKQDSYQYRTFYYCTSLYHTIRGAATWGFDSRTDQEKFFYPNEKEIPQSYTQLFYDKKNVTIQNIWNTLYNEYCDRVRWYVKESELQAADGRHANWTEKDTGVKTFSSVPGTTPT